MSGRALSAMARRKRRAKERGVALVLVLGAITIMTVFLTELQEETSSELSSALAERDRLRAEYYARSAVNLSRLLIAAEPTIRRTVAPIFMFMKMSPPQLPVWEFSDMVLGPFNDETAAAGFTSLAGLDATTGKNLGLTGGGHFELKIVDEDSKINVNIAARGDAISENRLAAQLIGLMAPPQYNPMFEGRDADDQFSDRATICGALVDWADPDENLFTCDPKASGPSAGGAEDSFYQIIDLPYRRKNTAYDSLDELRFVRGMGDDFWATFVDPDPTDPKKRLMTVWGQGEVNVNTANTQTILAIVCANAVETTELCNDFTQLAVFIQTIEMVRPMLMGAPLFSSKKNFISTFKGKGLLGQMLFGDGMAAFFGGVALKPIQFKSESELQKQISVESKLFSIYADGVVPGRQRQTRVRIHAVVDVRNALPPGAAMPSILGGTPQPPPTAPSGQTPPAGSTGGNTQAASGATPEAMLAALNSNPAGTIVYWRVE